MVEDKDFPKTKPFKETLAYQGIKKAWRLATKNMIPSDPNKIIEMKNRLIEEEMIKEDAVQAKIKIKEILKSRKERIKAIKRERRRKIKVFCKMIYYFFKKLLIRIQ